VTHREMVPPARRGFRARSAATVDEGRAPDGSPSAICSVMPFVVATLQALVVELVAVHGGWVQGGFASTLCREPANVQRRPLRTSRVRCSSAYAPSDG